MKTIMFQFNISIFTSFRSNFSNDVIEVTPLLTEKIDVTSLNQLTYAAAITAIKTARVENECIIKKRNINRTKGDWTFNMNRQINEFSAAISKISQMNNPRPSPKMKSNANSMKAKYQIVDEKTRSTSLETLKQRLYALNNRLSRYQRRQKQYQQNNDFINKQSKLFDELRGINYHHGPTNQGRHRKVLEAAI